MKAVANVIVVSFMSSALATINVGEDGPEISPLPNDSSLLLEAEKYRRPSQTPPKAEKPGRKADSGKSKKPSTSGGDGPDCALDGVVCDLSSYIEPVPETKKELTLGDVREEVERVGLPAIAVEMQPQGKTLVNLETIFYARAPQFERTVEILDFEVDLRGKPMRFTWHHGDGSQQTTSSPGRKYPHQNVTHTYKKAAAKVQPRVDVSYTVSFRIDGSDWQTLPDAIVAPGPAGSLTVNQGQPQLTKP